MVSFMLSDEIYYRPILECLTDEMDNVLTSLRQDYNLHNIVESCGYDYNRSTHVIMVNFYFMYYYDNGKIANKCVEFNKMITKQIDYNDCRYELKDWGTFHIDANEASDIFEDLCVDLFNDKDFQKYCLRRELDLNGLTNKKEKTKRKM